MPMNLPPTLSRTSISESIAKVSTATMDQTHPEKKRKHHNKEHSSSKKRKHAAAVPDGLDVDMSNAVSSTPKASKQAIAVTSETADPGSPFRLINATLYLPLSPISISPTHAQASLVTEHLAPLLLTYYPPFKGIVLAYSNASISSTPPAPGQVKTGEDNSDIPKPLTLALTANEYGVLYLYLTATFLVFSPQKGQILEGWVNVQSEGFLGAIAYNLFSVGIERKRVPKSWKWIPPGADGDDTASVNGGSNNNKNRKKGYISATSGDEDDSNNNNGSNKPVFDAELEHFTPLPKAATRKPIPTDIAPEGEQDDDDEDDDSNTTGYFQSVSGHRVRGTIRFRVRDVDVIPGADPDRGFLSIEGTMLTPEEEARLEDEERSGPLPSNRQRDPTAMSGGIPQASQPNVTEVRVTETAKPSKEERKKEKKSKDKHKSKSKA